MKSLINEEVVYDPKQWYDSLIIVATLEIRHESRPRKLDTIQREVL